MKKKKQKPIGLRTAAARVLDTMYDEEGHATALVELEQALLQDRARVARSVARTRARSRKASGHQRGQERL